MMPHNSSAGKCMALEAQLTFMMNQRGAETLAEVPVWDNVQAHILAEADEDSLCASYARLREGPSLRTWMRAMSGLPDLPRCWVLLARQIAAAQCVPSNWRELLLLACTLDSAALVRAVTARCFEAQPSGRRWTDHLIACQKAAALVVHGDMPDTWAFAGHASYETAWEALVDAVGQRSPWFFYPTSVEILRAMLRRPECAHWMTQSKIVRQLYTRAGSRGSVAAMRAVTNAPAPRAVLDRPCASHADCYFVANFMSKF